MGEKYDALARHLRDVHNIEGALGLLEWDQETIMPEDAVATRAAQLETLARVHHQMFTSEETARLLEDARAELGDADPDSDAASMVRVVQRDYDDAVKLPTDFVAEWSSVTTLARPAWVQARAENDFSIFQPHLERIVELSRQKADYIGFTDNPYDALLDNYENSLTSAEVNAIFEGHRGELVELVAAVSAVADRVDDSPVHQALPIEKQRAFSRWIAEQIGFDFKRGRMDESVHPFSSSASKLDSRITTRFDPNWLNPALFGTMHECGHSMYEQGIGDNIDGTMLGSGTSLSVHESQSRTWENLVGRSRGFWTWAYPHLVKTFPDVFGNVDIEDFYKAINKVSPSYIRVEADEATYNLHVMVRFNLEQQIIGGQVAVKDIPDAWNTLFNEYLGVTPPTDSEGCLQDVHWSLGLFGYFSTYALGNLLAVQYYNKAVSDVPSIPSDIERGDFSTLLGWSNTNIHQHGRKFDTKTLTQRVTGGEISSRPYIDYLKAKFSAVYGL
jgi:carboxypeptidase Taq